MTYASATAAGRRNYRRNQNTVSFADARVKLGPISNFAVLLVLACLLAVVYLSQVTKTNSYSYSLDALTAEKSQLQDDLTSLQVESARIQSLDRIKQSKVAANLTDPVDVIYAN